METAGSFVATVSVGNDAIEAEFTVIEGKGQALLGSETATQLNVLKLGEAVDVNVLKQDDIFDKYKSCFEGLGKLNVLLLSCSAHHARHVLPCQHNIKVKHQLNALGMFIIVIAKNTSRPKKTKRTIHLMNSDDSPNNDYVFTIIDDKQPMVHVNVGGAPDIPMIVDLGACLPKTARNCTLMGVANQWKQLVVLSQLSVWEMMPLKQSSL